MSGEHFIERCSGCFVILSQCRYAGEKKTRFGTCGHCKDIPDQARENEVTKLRKQVERLRRVIEDIQVTTQIASVEKMCGEALREDSDDGK